MRDQRRLGVLALVLLGLVAAGGATFYLRPIWVITQGIRFRLFRAGASTRYAQVSVDSASYRIHYYVAGNGPAVVLVHGIGSSGENWAAMLPALTRAGFRVYLPDLLGFGRSQRPHVDYSMSLQAEVLHRFLLQQGVRRATVGGVSMGGWVALTMAARYPDQVSKLLLIDSAGTTFAPTFDRALFEPRTVPQLQRLINKLTPRAPKLPDFIGRDILRAATPSGWVMDRALASMFAGRDVMDAHLQTLRMPTLILWGEEDQVIPVSTARFLHREIKGSRLQTFSGCGHLLVEVCGERIVPSILEFFQSP